MHQRLQQIISEIWGEHAPASGETAAFIEKVRLLLEADARGNEKTEWKKKFSETEDRYRLIIEGTSAGIWDWADISRDEEWWSPRFYELLGYEPGEIPAAYSSFLSMVHPDDVANVDAHVQANYKTHSPISIEYRLKTKSGDYKWFLANAQFRQHPDSHVTRLAGSLIDIDARKKAEEKLMVNEERFRGLIEAARDIFYTTNQFGTFTYVNKVAFDKTGYLPEELVGLNFITIVRDDYKDRVRLYYHKQVSEKVPFSYLEFPVPTKSGGEIWIGQNVQLIFKNGQYTGTQAIVRDITNIKNAERALQASEERFRKLVQYSSDITTVLSAGGIIMYESPSFYRVFGYKEPLVGKNVFEFVHPDDVMHTQLEFQRGIEKGGVSDPIEFRFRAADGRWKYVEAIGNNLLDEPAIRGIVVNSRETTERKKVERDLLRAKNEAEDAAKAKTDFLSNMSHEIRTPMNAIMGITDLLMQKEFESESQEYLRSIKYSADNLLVIINDILDFSKIESGKITFEQIDFNLNERIAELHKTFRHKTEERGIAFITVIDINTPEVVKGDPYRLNQILFNLVGNATKFTLKGFVKVHISVVEESTDAVMLRFDVQDTGIGIPKDKQESIFESFTQAYTDTTRKFGGTGLGLAITKNLAILQGGKIFLSSVPDEGTTFSVEIPFKKATTKFVKSQAMQNTDQKDLAGLRLLLVEDNIMNQFVARQIIGKWNAEISIANNGSEAIEQLGKAEFDLVLMDLQMPEMSGYQASEYIRSKNTTVKNPSIPIIALTADAFAETKRKVFEAGMNDFVTKPFNQEELYAKIVKHSQ